MSITGGIDRAGRASRASDGATPSPAAGPAALERPEGDVAVADHPVADADDGSGSPPGPSTSAHIAPVRGTRRTPSAARLGMAVGLAASWGILAGAWTPRGPLTTGEALASIVVGVVVGFGAAVVARSQWVVLAGPVAFAVAFEIVRWGTDGPTVDLPRQSTYGLLALLVGRGFHGLVSLAPMAWAAAIGVGWARRRDHGARSDARVWRRRTRQVVAGVLGVGLVVFAAQLARPAGTDEIVDADGDPLPGSIAELVEVDVNGNRLTMLIRGHATDLPVLLFLAGGPGGSELGAMRNHLPELEEHFVVVTWDQRGTGHSYTALDPTDTYTLDSAVDDTLAVTDYLRERFGRERIVLAGQSWGSLLGVLAVQARPEAFSSFVGSGQMVSPLATDTIFYEDTLDWAEANGHPTLVSDLEANGPPPYDDMLDYEPALSYEHEVYEYDHAPNSEGAGGFSENFFVEEYALIDQVHLLAGFVDTFSVLYPQIQGIDLRESAIELDVPVVFVQGAHEAGGRAIPFAEWYDLLDAPSKELVVLDTSGHRPLFEQPDEFVDALVEHVVPGAEAGSG